MAVVMEAQGTRAVAGTRPRVLMVSPRFLPHLGGVETHVYELARRINRDGITVEVMTIDDTGLLPEAEELAGLKIWRVPGFRSSGEARIAPGLVRAIRNGHWDILHIQHFHAGVAPLALWAARAAGIPTVVTFHGGGQRHWLRLRLWPPQPSLVAPLVLDATRALLRKAAALIAVAQFEIDTLSPRLGIPRARFALIPNGFDPPASVQRDTPRDPSAPRLVSMGRLVQGKGHHRVIAALPHVLAARPGATLWIAGDGPMKQELAERAASAGVAERVRFHAIPASERPRLMAELANQDVLVAISDFEAHPLSVIEALSLGLSAVVAEDRGGLSEIASQGLARCVAPNAAPQELAKAILAEIDDPSQVSPRAFPTWNDCAARTREIYERILLENGLQSPPGAGEARRVSD